MKRIVVDAKSQCVGCRQCQLSCSLEHEGQFAPWLSRVRLDRDQNLVLTNPVTCQQCEDASCAAACPMDGVFQLDEKTGVLFIDRDKCVGCKQCIEACPFDVIAYNEPEGIAMKCDLCFGDPACVKACPAGVLKPGGR